MATIFKNIGAFFGSAQQQAPTQSILNVAAPADQQLPSQKDKILLPVADDKSVQLKERQRIQKLYAGRGRQGSTLGSGGGDETYG